MMVEDPVYTRWKHRHPRFPGVAKCVELLRRNNTRGSLVDIICGELESHAASHSGELLASFRNESNGSVRRILLGIIADSRLADAVPLLVELLYSPDDDSRQKAARGLRLLDTAEARKALWEAGQH